MNSFESGQFALLGVIRQNSQNENRSTELAIFFPHDIREKKNLVCEKSTNFSKIFKQFVTNN